MHVWEALHGLLTVAWVTHWGFLEISWMGGGEDNLLWTGPDMMSDCGPGAVCRFFRPRRGRVQ